MTDQHRPVPADPAPAEISLDPDLIVSVRYIGDHEAKYWMSPAEYQQLTIHVRNGFGTFAFTDEFGGGQDILINAAAVASVSVRHRGAYPKWQMLVDMPPKDLARYQAGETVPANVACVPCNEDGFQAWVAAPSALADRPPSWMRQLGRELRDKRIRFEIRRHD